MFALFPYSHLGKKVLAGRRTSIIIPCFLFYSWISLVCFILFPLIWIFFPSMFAFPVDIIFSWFIFLNPLSSSSYLYSSPFPLYLFSFLSSHYFAIVKFPGFSSVSHPLWGTSHWWLWSSPPEGPPCDRDTLQGWQGPAEPRGNGSTDPWHAAESLHGGEGLLFGGICCWDPRGGMELSSC